MPSPCARWWSASGLAGSYAPVTTNRAAPRPQHEGVVVAVAGLGAGVGDQLHAEGGLEEVRGLRRRCRRPRPAASQPVTGNGSADGVVLDQADQLLELVEVEVGEALLVVQGLLEAHARTGHPVAPAAQAASGARPSARLGYWRPDLLGRLHSCGMVETRSLDALDVALLTALREHPRAGALELSRITGVARATVSARLQRLEDGGVVTGYGPDVDVAAAGFGVQAFVTLEIAQGALEDVQRDLEAIPGLLEAHATTGSGDVLCRVAAGSHEALQQVLVDDRSPAVVRSTSVVALSVLVPCRTLPLLGRGRAGRRAGGRRGADLDFLLCAIRPRLVQARCRVSEGPTGAVTTWRTDGGPGAWLVVPLLPLGSRGGAAIASAAGRSRSAPRATARRWCRRPASPPAPASRTDDELLLGAEHDVAVEVLGALLEQVRDQRLVAGHVDQEVDVGGAEVADRRPRDEIADRAVHRDRVAQRGDGPHAVAAVLAGRVLRRAAAPRRCRGSATRRRPRCRPARRRAPPPATGLPARSRTAPCR